MKSIKLYLILSFMLVLVACGNNPESNESDNENGDESASGDEIVIRMANQVEENNFLNQGYVAFKEYIEEESDGRISVEIHNGGTIAASDEQIVEVLNNGSIDLSTSSSYGVANTTNVKGFNLFDMPYMFESREEMYELVDGEYGEMLAEEVAETQNVEVLGFTDLGYYSIMNGSHAVETPEDLDGLTIRSSAATMHLDTVTAFGANPTSMDYSEVFTSLQQGTIDGVSTTTPLIYGDRFFEVNNHLTLTNQVLLPHILMVNKSFYEGLDEEAQEILADAVDHYIETSRELAIEAEQEAIDEMEAEGVEIVDLDDQQREAFMEAAEPVREQNIDIVGEDNYNKAMDLMGR